MMIFKTMTQVYIHKNNHKIMVCLSVFSFSNFCPGIVVLCKGSVVFKYIIPVSLKPNVNLGQTYKYGVYPDPVELWKEFQRVKPKSGPCPVMTCSVEGDTLIVTNSVQSMMSQVNEQSTNISLGESFTGYGWKLSSHFKEPSCVLSLCIFLSEKMLIIVQSLLQITGNLLQVFKRDDYSNIRRRHF